MARLVSLTDDAYLALLSFKRAGDSFSKVVLEVCGNARKNSAKRDIMSFAGMWANNPEYDEIFAKILENRNKRRGTWEHAARY